MTAGGAHALRKAARLALIAGALGSLGLMLYAGRHNKHLFITALFTVWVLAPFASLALADFFSRRWPPRVGRTLHGMTILVALASLAVYVQDAIWPRQAQAAFVYVAVPPATWLASALVVGAAAILARSPSRRTGERPGGAGP